MTERDELIDLLRKQADEIASAGHNGWGNTMLMAADWLERVPEWIPINERLPDCKAPILMVAVRDQYITDQYAGWRSGKEWTRWPHKFSPTHWMPQTAAPKEVV